MPTKSKHAPNQRMLHVTAPGGKVSHVPDDGRTFPPGTMLMWDEEVGGRREMLWTIIGCAWPFDD